MLFGVPDNKEFPKLSNNKRHPKETTSNHDNQSTLSNKLLTTWKDELQILIVAIEEKKQKQVETQCKDIELKLDYTLQKTLN